MPVDLLPGMPSVGTIEYLPSKTNDHYGVTNDDAVSFIVPKVEEMPSVEPGDINLPHSEFGEYAYYPSDPATDNYAIDLLPDWPNFDYNSIPSGTIKDEEGLPI